MSDPRPYPGGVNVPAPPPPTPTRGRISIPLVLFVLAIVGAAIVGAITFARDREPATPGESVQAFVRAVARSDSGATCDLIAESNLDDIEDRGTTCEESFERVLADIEASDGEGGFGSGIYGSVPGRAPKVEIVDEKIDGDQAEVVVRIDGEDPDPDGPILLVKEDGGWKLDLLAGSDGSVCQTEARTLRTAVELYRAQFDRDPVDTEELVDARFLADAPRSYRVGPDGKVLAKPGGDCD